MADPVSITGLVLQIGVLLKQLHDYGKEVKSARKGISALSSELYALKGVLEDCKVRHDQSSSDDDLFDVLKAAQDALIELLAYLEPPHSRARRVKQSLWWPMKSDDVAKILRRLERVKTTLLLDLMGDVHDALSDLREMRKDVKTIAQTVGQEFTRRKELEANESTRELLEQIAPASPEATHNQICSIPRDLASGAWFLDGPFKHWMHESPQQTQILSLVGMSGAGKSTLVASTIESLKLSNVDKPLIGYMYCTYNDSATRETRNILGAWVAQLSSAKPAVLHSLAEFNKKNLEAQIAQLSDALVNTANACGSILLILDALNESKEPASLCFTLVQLLKRSKSIRMLISSTSNLDVASMESADLCRTVNITASLILPDLKVHIKRKRLENAVLSRVPEELFLDAILPRANGMFRWACCQIDLVGQYNTPKKVKEALLRLPGSLDDTYVALLQRVPAVSRDLVREALLWLCYSPRPMRLSELVDAVVLEEEDEIIDSDCRIFPPSRLVEICEGLVSWQARTDFVSLAHSSVRTFLTSDFISTSPVASFKLDAKLAELSIIRKCLTYLLMTPFSLGYCTRAKLWQFHDDYPFLEYAATTWTLLAHPYAVARALSPSELQLIEKLFQTHGKNSPKSNFIFWVYCLIPESSYLVVKMALPLYYAASFGLTQVVDSILSQHATELSNRDSPWYIDRKAGRAFSTALQVACWRGHEGVVSALLKAGADPSSRAASGLTNLDCSKEMGFPRITRMLLEAEAKSPRSHGLTEASPDHSFNMVLAGSPYTGRANVMYLGSKNKSERESDD